MKLSIPLALAALLASAAWAQTPPPATPQPPATPAGPQAPVPGAPAPRTLDELLEQVRNLRETEAQANREREQRFLAQRDRQAQLLEEARATLIATEQRSDELRASFDENERELAELETTLSQRMATMGEMFGAVRQVAGDALGTFDVSLVSAQIPGRGEFMSELAQSRELPEIPQLERLWYEIMREMNQSGKVVSFQTNIIRSDGQETQARVTRVGVFNAMRDGQFLTYLSGEGRLYELARQPAGRYQRMARNLEQAESGLINVPLDPSRGAILGALVQTPSFRERIAQGGIVGYIIIFLLLPLGLLIAIERLVYLTVIGSKVDRQLKSDTPDTSNPLGRVMRVYLDNQHEDVETLELKLDEAIIKDTPKLERGINTIKILAAVAPLMGLLGTVTGMIRTFQDIQLFGTGDPRMMAGGISEALMTTAMGLVTAIPLVLLHSIVTGKSNRLVQILDEQSAGYVAQTSEARHDDAG
jgi:biopolymer transport protein ExbB